MIKIYFLQIKVIEKCKLLIKIVLYNQKKKEKNYNVRFSITIILTQYLFFFSTIIKKVN